MQRKVRQLNRWLLFLIVLVLCAIPIQSLIADKLQGTSSVLSFGMPTDDVVLMLYSNTARAGNYLVPIDEQEQGAAPYITDGETLVPARFLARHLDANLSINEELGSIQLSSDEIRLEYKGMNAQAHVNGSVKQIKMSAAPVVKNGITYVPLRAASQAFDRSLFVKDGIVFMTRSEHSPDASKWKSWQEELAPYLAYDTFGSYTVETEGQLQALFHTWNEAVAYAKQSPGRTVRYRNETAMWDPSKAPPSKYMHQGAPLILQLPELPRGCEVTVLAMLLQEAGVNVDKMELASKVRKDTTPFQKSGGKTYFGNPHDGFVGDMYTFDNPGLGVYHEPIAELAEQYLPGRIADLTGTSFNHLLWTVGQGMPTWVIHTTLYDEVPAHAWRTWQTPSGPVDVTYYEHSLLVIGYDQQYVYVHDPLGRKDKISRDAFQRGWEQMGSQAITVLPQSQASVQAAN